MYLMNSISNERTREICKELKTLVLKLEKSIENEETRITLEIEAWVRPSAGIKQSRPNSAHNYWIGGLRSNGLWYRNHNY